MDKQYVEEGQRCLLWEKLEAWQRAAGAGMTTCEGLNAESACAELQLAQPVYAFGFLPTLQRRLAVLRELGAVIAEEQRCATRVLWSAEKTGVTWCEERSSSPCCVHECPSPNTHDVRRRREIVLDTELLTG